MHHKTLLDLLKNLDRNDLAIDQGICYCVRHAAKEAGLAQWYDYDSMLLEWFKTWDAWSGVCSYPIKSDHHDGGAGAQFHTISDKEEDVHICPEFAEDYRALRIALLDHCIKSLEEYLEDDKSKEMPTFHPTGT